MCDKEIILKNGRIVEQGTYDELLEYCGEYAQMYKSRWKAFELQYAEGLCVVPCNAKHINKLSTHSTYDANIFIAIIMF